MIGTWPSPNSDGKISEELLVSFDSGREKRLLIAPALFDELNKLRRFTIEFMRHLDARGIDSFLPDLPGMNESLQPLAQQTVETWRSSLDVATKHVSATHIVTFRGGALLSLEDLPGFQYAPTSGSKILRGMIRARTIAAKENGKLETSDALMDTARKDGITLAGYSLGAELFRELEVSEPRLGSSQTAIEQKALGGPGLWLRAEPDENNEQAEALAQIVAERLT